MAGVLQRKPDYKHLMPFCCLPTWRMEHGRFYVWTRASAQQSLPVPRTRVPLLCHLTCSLSNSHVR